MRSSTQMMPYLPADEKAVFIRLAAKQILHSSTSTSVCRVREGKVDTIREVPNCTFWHATFHLVTQRSNEVELNKSGQQ